MSAANTIGVIVEKASGDDLDHICSLDATVWGDSSRQNLLAKAFRKNQCWVARLSETLVGFAILERSFYGHAFVSLVVVHPEHRRQGAATGLIQGVESDCAGEKLFTSTNHSNTGMQKVLENLGFVRSGYIENLDRGDPEIVYFKKVDSKS